MEEFTTIVSNFTSYVNSNVECEPIKEYISSWQNARSNAQLVLMIHDWLNVKIPDLTMLINVLCAKYQYKPDEEVANKLHKYLRYLQLASQDLVTKSAN